jgi:REP element-mobilizing transposase RayT
VLYGQLRKHLGEVLHRLAAQKENRIEQGHLLADHVHMLISIPPKYAVAQVVGFMKGKARSTWQEPTGPETELRRAKLLGAGILFVHCRSG